MATPHCHSAIRKHRGRAGAGYYFFDFRALYDGLHADNTSKGGKTVRKLWAKALRAAMIKNFDTHCDHDDAPPPPKRPWRGGERRTQ